MLPFYHIGLNEVYPPVDPPLKREFHSNKLVTCIWGEPISFRQLIDEFEITNFDDEMDLISRITDRIQAIMFDMRVKCEQLHEEHLLEENRLEQLASFREKMKEQTEPQKRTETFYQIYTDKEL